MCTLIYFEFLSIIDRVRHGYALAYPYLLEFGFLSIIGRVRLGYALAYPHLFRIHWIIAPRREAPRRLLFSNAALRRTSVRQCVCTDFLENHRMVSAPGPFHHYTVLSRGLIFGFQNGSRNNRISAERSDRLGPCFWPLLENFFGIFENTD